MKHIKLSTISLFVILGCTTSMAQEQRAPKQSTFFEDTEPTILIKPLTREQQNSKEKETLTGGIQNLNIQPITPAFELVKGKRVEDQLRAFGKKSGWNNLIWQAPEYVLDQNMMIPGDFEPAVLFFLNGANEAGARLRAVFYRGNKTVRITEF